MSRMPFAVLSLAGLPLLFAACGADTGDRRVIEIVQKEDGCTPASITLKAGEKVAFQVKNEAGKTKEVEGIEGTKLPEVTIPGGRTRTVNYTAPGSEGTAKIKCYQPGGATTIIELNVSGTAAVTEDGDQTDTSRVTGKPANDTVNVSLIEFSVTPDKASVAAGPTKFVATNTSKTQVHELAVLRVKDDGSFETAGEVEDIEPGKSGEVVLDLPAGKYQLACLIAPGEAGSTADHFKEGMHTSFEVK
ncbi:MAG: cupredoxin domain-containing protein [Chloroflexi bacterium]|nr:cupredoxin domain-containing protein [Chloroflexota bacterium]